MGIVFEEVQPVARDPISLGAGEPGPVKVPGIIDTVAAAFRQNNPLVGIYNGLNLALAERPQADPNFNPIDYIRGTKYFERYAGNFLGARSLDETQQIMARIDAEERDQQLLAAAGNGGVIASIGAGLLDPTIFLPAGAVYRTARGGHDILRTARSFMLGGASQAILAEAALQAGHETYGFSDAAFSVGSAAILGGLLGAGVAKSLSRAELQGLTKALDREREILGDHLAGNVQKNVESPPVAQPTPAGFTRFYHGGHRADSEIAGLDNLWVSPQRDYAANFRRNVVTDLNTGQTTRGPENKLWYVDIPNTELGKLGLRDEINGHNTNGNLPKEWARKAQPVETVSEITPPLAASAGAAAADERALNVASYGLDKIPVVRDVVKRLFPDLRTYQSAGVQARRALADLAETALLFDENRAGLTTTLRGGPALSREVIMFTDGFRANFGEELHRLWSELKYGDAGPTIKDRVGDALGTNNTGLTYDQFKRLVFDAINKADRHEIPQVAAAAQYLRKRLFDVMGPRAEKAIPEFKMWQGREGESFAPHMPDKDKINANRPEAVDDITRWYAQEQDVKRSIQTSLKALKTELDKITKRLEKLEAKASAGNEAALAEAVELQAQAAAIRSRIESFIASWNGKTVNEAKAALKARAKYEENMPRGEGSNRLTQADSAVDGAVERILKSDRNRPIDELRAKAEETLDRWIGGPDGRLPYEEGSNIGHNGGPRLNEDLRGSLAEREFNLPFDIKKKWLIDDVESVVSGYLRSVVPDVLLAERFGDIRMTEVFRKHNEEYAALIAEAKGPKERLELQKERDRVTADLAAVRDRIRGVYGFSTDTQLRNAARIAAGAKRANNLISGGMMAVSSLPDIAGVVFRHGLSSAFSDGWQPFFNAMTDKTAWEAAQKAGKEWRAVGIAVETSIASRQRSIDDITELYRSQSRVERALEFANDKFFIANLLAPFTDLQKSIAANVASANILRAAEAVAKGKATKKQISLLGESNINPATAEKIWAEFQKGGEVIDGIYVPNTADWTAADARRAFQGAVARDVDIAVVTPGQEKPLWMSNPVWGVLGQFKSFVASSTERILIANLQRHDAAAAQGLVFSVALGMLAYRIHTLAAGTPVSDRPQDWLKEGLSRSGVLGWMEEGNSIVSKGSRGAVDIYRLIGADKPLSRYANRNAADLVLGPTWGKIQNLLKVTGSLGAGEWTASDTHAVRLLFATQNLLYTRMLFDQVENGFNSAFGIPARTQ